MHHYTDSICDTKVKKLSLWIKRKLRIQPRRAHLNQDQHLALKEEQASEHCSKLSLRNILRISIKHEMKGMRSNERKNLARDVRDTYAGTSSLFSILPQDTQLEILSFIYDDTDSIEAYLACPENQINRTQLKRHISLCILSSSNCQVFCRMCAQPTCYPYKLNDCGHQVCGRCAWDCRQERRPCGCGVKICSRLHRLDSRSADCRAYWILNREENKVRFERNEARVHRDPDGLFGTNGTPNSIDPFDRVSFEADYDYLPSLDIRSEFTEQLPSDCGRLFIQLCPSHENYRPYIIAEFEARDLEQVWSVLHDQRWLRCICNEDILTLEEEALESRYTKGGLLDELISVEERSRFESRLVGWEDLAGDCADYDF